MQYFCIGGLSNAHDRALPFINADGANMLYEGSPRARTHVMWCLSVRSHFRSGYLWDTMLLTPVGIQQEYRVDQSNIVGRWLRL